jgi:hypothetical protein
MFPFRRSTAGFRVPEENPGCGGWSALSLLVLIALDSGHECDSPDSPAYETIRSRQSRSRCQIHSSWFRSPYRDVRRRLQAARQSTRVLHPDTCGSLPIRDSHPCSQALNAVRLLQLVVPTSTRFTAPLLAQPDLSREKSLASRSSARLTAHTSHNG